VIGWGLGSFCDDALAQEKSESGLDKATVGASPQVSAGDAASMNQWIDRDVPEIVAIDAVIEGARLQWQVPG